MSTTDGQGVVQRYLLLHAPPSFSAQTHRHYKQGLEFFLAFVERTAGYRPAPRGITPDMVLAWLAAMEARGLASCLVPAHPVALW